MRIMRTVSQWALWISVALLGMPGLAAAQNAVLYEVTETMNITGSPAYGVRSATATLMGVVDAGTSICPAALGVRQCSIVARATDSLDLGSGKGPVVGQFAVVVQGDNFVDGPELVLVRGRLRGTIDLSPAVNYVAPIGTLSGKWWARGQRGTPLEGLRVSGTLSGTFRLPFVFGLPQGCLDDGDPSDCVYVSKPSYWTDQGPVELIESKWGETYSGEYSLGVPTVRLELTFTESASSRSDDDD